ncbi:MAG TPA: hypothetical protein VF789_23470 [Thermoanaerobaculia bacterium]
MPENFPGREALQVSLDVLLAGTCARHDACYRECTGVPYSIAHKNTCDLLFFLELEAWCGAVSTAQELANIGLSAEDFLPPCVAAMIGAYVGVQTLGLSAYLEDQVACDPCLNGQRWFECYLQGGNFDQFSCTCSIDLCGDKTSLDCPLGSGASEQFPCMCGVLASPVILDLGGNGFHLAGFENGVSFDINGDHVKERIGWTRPDADDAFLVLDRNRNGKVDDGLELFGNVASQPASKSPNGFRALEMFDRPTMGGNGDGKLTAADLVFPALRLWRDADQDGVSAPGELSSLAAWGIVEIDLGYKESRRRDAEGNEFRYRAHVTFADGTKKFAYDVFFTRQTP